MRLLPAAVLTTLSGWVHAHPGHGIDLDTHWHATDTWGFLLAGALVALALWLSRGGK